MSGTPCTSSATRPRSCCYDLAAANLARGNPAGPIESRRARETRTSICSNPAATTSWELARGDLDEIKGDTPLRVVLRRPVHLDVQRRPPSPGGQQSQTPASALMHDHAGRRPSTRSSPLDLAKQRSSWRPSETGSGTWRPISAGDWTGCNANRFPRAGAACSKTHLWKTLLRRVSLEVVVPRDGRMRRAPAIGAA